MSKNNLVSYFYLLYIFFPIGKLTLAYGSAFLVKNGSQGRCLSHKFSVVNQTCTRSFEMPIPAESVAISASRPKRDELPDADQERGTDVSALSCRSGRPRADDHLTLNGISVFRGLCLGTAGRDTPVGFGPWLGQGGYLLLEQGT